MQDRAILRTLLELDRWRERQAALRREYESRARPRDLRPELEKVNRQVAYYAALAQDMKRETRPARVRDLLRIFH